jgi:hypothetical protein
MKAVRYEWGVFGSVVPTRNAEKVVYRNLTERGKFKDRDIDDRKLY